MPIRIVLAIALIAGAAAIMWTKTGEILVGPASLKPTFSSVKFDQEPDGKQLRLLKEQNARPRQPHRFTAPVQLPDGAVIREVEFNFEDDGPGRITAQLVQKLDRYTASDLVTSDFSKNVTGWQQETIKDIDDATVDNSMFFYEVQVNFYSDDDVDKGPNNCSVGDTRIKYAIPALWRRVLQGQ